MGDSAGYLWPQTNVEKMDGNYEIPFDVLTQPYTENLPDVHKLFHELSMIQAAQASGFVGITPYVDNEQQTQILCPIETNRKRLRRIGNGRLLSVEFIHDTMYEDCEIFGFEIPFTITGRR